MTTPDTSNEAAPTTLSALAKALLFISVVLAGFLFGAGVENFMDEGSNWIQIYKAVFPALIALFVGYVLVQCRES
jgi:tetrahydromethanopterin S-methyltransferase subunit D